MTGVFDKCSYFHRVWYVCMFFRHHFPDRLSRGEEVNTCLHSSKITYHFHGFTSQLRLIAVL